MLSRREWVFFLLAFVTYAYFQGETRHNQIARLAPVFSFVEPGQRDYHTLRIDWYCETHATTLDWSLYGGHYYSNKAPGSTWLALPLYWGLFHLEKVFSPDFFERWRSANTYLLNLWGSVFWAAVGAVAFFRLLRRVRGWSEADAWPVAFCFAFATIYFPFSTTYWGHCTAAAFLILGYLALWEERPVAGALWLAAAVTCEYACLLTLPLAFAFVYGRMRSAQARTIFLVVGLAALFPLLLYQKIIFGGWFHTATQFTNPDQLNTDRALGLFGAFQPASVLGLLFSPSRGLFVYMPVLAAVFYGGWIREQKPWTYAIALGHIALYFFLIGSFNGWHGGASAGPRYLIATLPFWCLLLPAWSRLTSWQRGVTGALGAVSLANMLVVASSSTMIFVRPWKSLLYDVLWNIFLTGRETDVGNFGKWITQLPLPWTVLPLVIAWIWITRQEFRNLPTRPAYSGSAAPAHPSPARVLGRLRAALRSRDRAESRRAVSRGRTRKRR